MFTTADREWEELLDPVAPRTFFGSHWERTPLHIPGSPGKFAPLFSRASFASCLLRHPHEKNCSLFAVFRDTRGNGRSLPIRPEQVDDCFSARMVIQLKGIEVLDRRLASLTQSLGKRLPLPAPLRMNGYLAPPGGLFPFHFDNNSSMTLQIEGTRTWTFDPQPVAGVPLEGFTLPPGEGPLNLPTGTVARPDEQRLVRIALHPGDLLYLPPYTWHSTQTQSSSVALLLKSTRVTPLEFLRDLLEPLLYRDPVWRRSTPSVLNEHASGGLPPAEWNAQAGQRLAELKEIVRSLDPAALQRAWRQRTGRCREQSRSEDSSRSNGS